MALTVGTDAYDSLANVDSYHASRGNSAWAAVTDATAREVFIRKATDWVDRNFSFIGDQATASQRLKWPRKYAELEGYALSETSIPWQVAEATAIIADIFRQGTVDLEGIVTNDSASLQMQKVDVITIQYDTARKLQGGAIPSHVHKLLSPLVRSANGSLLRA